MSTNTVNLDALIPREDFDTDAETPLMERSTTIDMSKLRDNFFSEGLRKPDFQRETSHWSPSKIVDLLKSFLNADLIPAIILWQSGPFTFVIDGAHRLSAIYAWIYDDYGDKLRSQKYFDFRIPKEQMAIAERTRKLVAKEIGTFDSYVAAQQKPISDLSADLKARMQKVRLHSFTAQWVLSNEPKVAEASFFKINQAATPLDATEVRILRARGSGNAMAARAITRGGSGHKYWKHFAEDVRLKIEDRSKALYKALYEPPMDEGYIKSTDVPVAGRGYNTLPFVFDLVNLANDQKITDSTLKRPINETLPIDTDGGMTVSYIDNVEGLVKRVTGHHAASLGLHPLIYFYSRTGTFQPVAFFATVKMLERFDQEKKLIAFTNVRAAFESYLQTHREGMSIIIHRLGSGARSLGWMQSYFERVLEGLWTGASIEKIREGFAGEREWEFITQTSGPRLSHDEPKPGNAFNKNTKSAAVIQGIENVRKCRVCGGSIHRNSIEIDHKERKRSGGLAVFSNAQVAHPYCNAMKDQITISDRSFLEVEG